MRPSRLLAISLTFCMISVHIPLSLPGQTSGNDNRGSGTKENPYIVPKIESKITVDAVLDETAWQDALVLELKYEVRPGENVTPPVRTEVLLTYDAKNFYAAFRCYDPDPSAIRSHLRDRDTLGGDDWIALILDTFNDERRSFDFIVTAQGVQFDQIEAQSGEDPGWDTIWKCASKITDWGYTVEIAIPFLSIRFQRKHGPQVWGFDAVRRYPREHAYHIGLFPRDRSNNCYMCQAIKIKGFEGASPGRNIEFDPTVIGFRSDERKDFPHGDFKKQSQEAELGLTAHWGITPNLTSNFTLNPDFSQVEADAQQLDINEPFALFYPERRPFFTEGTDFFAALENIIYTRTMRDPSWGLKLTGKEGATPLAHTSFVMKSQTSYFLAARDLTRLQCIRQTHLLFSATNETSAADILPGFWRLIVRLRVILTGYSGSTWIFDSHQPTRFNCWCLVPVQNIPMKQRTNSINLLELSTIDSSHLNMITTPEPGAGGPTTKKLVQNSALTLDITPGSVIATLKGDCFTPGMQSLVLGGHDSESAMI